jgi:hypothetical protein
MNRRDLLKRSVIGVATAALPMGAAQRSWASEPVDLQLRERLRVCTPKDALIRLQEGNARFVMAWGSRQWTGLGPTADGGAQHDLEERVSD